MAEKRVGSSAEMEMAKAFSLRAGDDISLDKGLSIQNANSVKRIGMDVRPTRASQDGLRPVMDDCEQAWNLV
jgi:hypothetical protein